MHVNTFGHRFSRPNNCAIRSKLCSYQLFGMAVNSSYCVSQIRGCVTGCSVRRSIFVRGAGLMIISKRAAFNGKIHITIVGRNNNHVIPVCSHLSTRVTCIVALCHRGRRLVSGVGTLVSPCTRSHKDAHNAVDRGIGVIGYNTVGSICVNPCTTLVNMSGLDGNSIGSGRRTPIRVNSNMGYGSFVLSSKISVASSALMDGYFMNRTARVNGRCSTVSSLFFTGYRKFRNRTATVFTKPCAIARRGSALLVTNVFSFVGTNSNSGRDGRVCGLNPVRRKLTRHNSGAADSSCVL